MIIMEENMYRNIFAILLIFIIMPVAPLPSFQPAFLDGVLIHGYDVGGLTMEEAKNLLGPKIEELMEQKIILQTPDNSSIRLTSYSKMGLEINFEEVLREGMKIGRRGSVIESWWEKLIVKWKKHNLPLEVSLNKEVAKKKIVSLTGDLIKEPKNAKLTVNKDKVIIEPDYTGLAINVEGMLLDLEKRLSLQGPITIKIIIEEVEAETTEDDLRKLRIEKLLGEYTTWFNPRKKNRTENIKMAAEAINNYILPPNEEFSFNKIVGPRTKETGYNEAPIILNNKFVPGVGGGVCQVSSTLYNALLRSNLTITERHPHSLPIRYVPKGMDAAVVYGFKDLKFINNTGGHILIKAYSGQGSLTIKLFGPAREDYKIEVLSIVEKTIFPETKYVKRPDIVAGQVVVEQQGEVGYVVRVERIIKDKNNNILVHEILTRDYYPPVEKIIATSGD